MTGPIQVTATVVGADAVVQRLLLRSRLAPDRIRRTLRVLGTKLENIVKRQFLTGQALHVRSGRLRRSINTKYSEQGDTFTASTGTNVSYGRVWEKGFHGSYTVHAFVRKAKSRNQRGWVMTSYNDVARKQTASGIAFVKQHTRTVNLRARPFLKPSLAQIHFEARQKLTIAVMGKVS